MARSDQSLAGAIVVVKGAGEIGLFVILYLTLINTLRTMLLHSPSHKNYSHFLVWTVQL